MHVDTAVFRHIQNFLRQYLPKSRYRNQLRIIFPQFLHKFRRFHAFRLQNSQTVRKRIFLYRGKRQLFASALRLVWLCYHRKHLMFS